MSKSIRSRLLIAAAVVAVVGFLLFRPDTLFTDVRSDESLEEAFAAPTGNDLPTAPTTAIPGASQVPSSRPDATQEASPTKVRPISEVEAVIAGSFFGIDHRASGTAAIYRKGDRFVLRLEDDTDIQNGPDLYVWLLESESYESGDPGEHMDLGTLTGNVGGQNYDLPEAFDPEVHRMVLIWCLRFGVPFAAAHLS